MSNSSCKRRTDPENVRETVRSGRTAPYCGFCAIRSTSRATCARVPTCRRRALCSNIRSKRTAKETAGCSTATGARYGEKWSHPCGEHLASGLHPGIVESAIWLGVQERLAWRGGSTNRGTGHTSWLQGSVVCSLCGEHCYTRCNGVDARYTYLVCRGKRSGFCTGIPALRASVVENAVAPVLARRAAELLPYAETPPPETADQAATALEELEGQIRRVTAAMGEPSAAVPFFACRARASRVGAPRTGTAPPPCPKTPRGQCRKPLERLVGTCRPNRTPASTGTDGAGNTRVPTADRGEVKMMWKTSRSRAWRTLIL